MITVLKNSTDFAFLSVLTDFNNVIILLIIEALSESVIAVIELAVFKLTVKE